METIKLTEEHRELIEWLASLTQTIQYMQEWLDDMKYRELLASVLAEAQQQEEIRQARIDLFMKQTERG